MAIKIVSIIFIASFGLGIHSLPAEEGGLQGTGDLDFDPASDADDNHCIVPQVPGTNALYYWIGLDLNELLGISERLIGAFCPRVVAAGQFYTPNVRWFTNIDGGSRDSRFNGLPGSPGPILPPLYGVPITYPLNYEPLDDEPIGDFAIKNDYVKYIVDQKKVYIFPAEDIRKLIYGAPQIPNDYPQFSFLAKLHPLPVGMRRVDVYLHMTSQHCHGRPIFMGSNPPCLNEGENLVNGFDFEVVDRSE